MNISDSEWKDYLCEKESYKNQFLLAISAVMSLWNIQGAFGPKQKHAKITSNTINIEVIIRAFVYNRVKK